MIEIGKAAPSFSLPDRQGKIHTLEEFRGHKVVLYFYPKDNTSGCTAQALGYKDLKEEFLSANTVIIGISKDSPSSHQKFIDKYDLNFLLLSDEECKTISDYGVWQEKSMYGKKYMGIVRSSFIIDEEGILRDKEIKVSPKENPTCSLNFVQGK